MTEFVFPPGRPQELSPTRFGGGRLLQSFGPWVEAGCERQGTRRLSPVPQHFVAMAIVSKDQPSIFPPPSSHRPFLVAAMMLPKSRNRQLSGHQQRIVTEITRDKRRKSGTTYEPNSTQSRSCTCAFPVTMPIARRPITFVFVGRATV